jgi:hypothetical protein
MEMISEVQKIIFKYIVIILAFSDGFHVMFLILWWHPGIKGMGYGFSKARATRFYKNGLIIVQHTFEMSNTGISFPLESLLRNPILML